MRGPGFGTAWCLAGALVTSLGYIAAGPTGAMIAGGTYLGLSAAGWAVLNWVL